MKLTIKTKKMYILEKIVAVIIIVAFLLLALSAAIVLVKRGFAAHEINECQKWQQEAIDYSDKGYFITDWQKAQCDHHDIQIKIK